MTGSGLWAGYRTEENSCDGGGGVILEPPQDLLQAVGPAVGEPRKREC